MSFLLNGGLVALDNSSLKPAYRERNIKYCLNYKSILFWDKVEGLEFFLLIISDSTPHQWFGSWDWSVHVIMFCVNHRANTVWASVESGINTENSSRWRVTYSFPVNKLSTQQNVHAPWQFSNHHLWNQCSANLWSSLLKICHLFSLSATCQGHIIMKIVNLNTERLKYMKETNLYEDLFQF